MVTLTLVCHDQGTSLPAK